MSYRVSSFACAITLFVAFLAAFASASPASIARGELGVVRRNNEVEDVPSQVHTGKVQRFGDQHFIVLILTPPMIFICVVVWKATWHYQTGLAACGGDFKDSDYGVALSPANFGDKSTCGKVRSTPFSGIW